MNKISEDFLNRTAYVYVRQSTRDQVNNNVESTRLQYGLKTKAREMGWSDVRIIDDDLGKTGSGLVQRAGFEHLLSEVCQGKVGAIFAIEASRLARNGKEWHTLLEMCGLLKTIIVDHDGVYNPMNPNDRLLLGMKGTISEMELSVFRQRSQAALKQKAQRGELYTSVAVGYVRANKDRIEKDPNKRIRNAVNLVFEKFKELDSIRQVLKWFREEKIKLPAAQKEGRDIAWKLPVYNTVWHMLTNPVYAGAYAYGKTETRIKVENGTKRKASGYRRVREDWQVLIIDNHEGYISWDEYLSFQEIIANNANMKGAIARGAVRKGNGLLAGILRCGHCGRKLHVAYSGTGGNVLRYECKGALINHGVIKCISFGGLRADRTVSETVLKVLSPLEIEEIMEAMNRTGEKDAELRRQKELELQQARYEAERMKRQFDRVEPENRLVASELERRWNEALAHVQSLELEASPAKVGREPLSESEKERLVSLAENLHFVWNHPDSDNKLKKRIIRLLIKEIIVSVEGDIAQLVIHWDGGDHSVVKFQKNKSGAHRWKTDVQTETIITELARIQSDQEIAALLNRLGKKTAKGNAWSKARVSAFRNCRKIPAFRKGEIQERGEMLVEHAAERLKTTKKAVYRVIRKKILPARQICFGAPWIIRVEDLEKIELQSLFRDGEAKKGPLPEIDQSDLFENPGLTTK